MSDWEIRIVGDGVKPASDFLANPDNWRIHPLHQAKGMDASLDKVGFVQRVIVNLRTSEEWGANRNVETLVDGHLRVQRALAKGDTTPVPFLYVDLEPEEETFILQTLDPLAYFAAADREKLSASIVPAIVAAEGEVKELLARIAREFDATVIASTKREEAEPDLDNAAAYQERWQVEPGDVWELGDHRIICGDAADPEVVSRLMAGEEAYLMVTDPPYGVDYGELVRSRKNQKAEGWDDIENDALTDEALQELLSRTLHGAGAKVGFVFHPAGPRRFLFWNAVTENGWRVAQEIVWVKNALVFGRADYQWRHEPILYLKRDGARPQEDRTQTTVWEVKKPTNSKHPTQKPVELYEIPIKNHTLPGEIVFEPFSGSGTAIIACQQQGRRCRAIELKPEFVALAIQRWVDLTLQVPVRLD